MLQHKYFVISYPAIHNIGWYAELPIDLVFKKNDGMLNIIYQGGLIFFHNFTIVGAFSLSPFMYQEREDYEHQG